MPSTLHRLLLLALVVGFSASARGSSPPSAEDVLRLPPDLAERLQREIGAVALSPERRVDLLVEFISAEGGFGFQYRAAPTRSVSELLVQARGNCLSFTLLFISSARALDLEVYPREVRVPLAWRQDDQLIFDVGHVNVGVETPGSRKTVDFDPDFLRSQRLASPYRGQRVSDERMLAHFYNNRAAELLGEARSELAAEWAARAIAVDPSFSPAYNTAGVIERRLGRPERAREQLRRALELAEDPAPVLFNLVLLERAQGRSQAAADHARHLAGLRTADPWFQWLLGRFYEDLSEFDRARHFHARAIELNATEPRFHRSLARVLFELGYEDEAAHALARAAELGISSEGSRQQARLDKPKTTD